MNDEREIRELFNLPQNPNSHDDFLDARVLYVMATNGLFDGSKPMIGKELDLLNECLSKNSKSVATLKDRK